MLVIYVFTMMWVSEINCATTTVYPSAGRPSTSAPETSTTPPLLAADNSPSRQPVPEAPRPKLINRGLGSTSNVAYEVAGNAVADYSTPTDIVVETGTTTLDNAKVQHTTQTNIVVSTSRPNSEAQHTTPENIVVSTGTTTFAKSGAQQTFASNVVTTNKPTLNAAVEFKMSAKSMVSTDPPIFNNAAVEHTSSTGFGMTTKLPVLANEHTTISRKVGSTTTFPTPEGSPVSPLSNKVSTQGTTVRAIGFDPLLSSLTQTQIKSGVGMPKETILPKPKAENTVEQKTGQNNNIANNPVPTSHDVTISLLPGSETSTPEQTTQGKLQQTSTTMPVTHGSNGQELLGGEAAQSTKVTTGRNSFETTLKVQGAPETIPTSTVQTIPPHDGTSPLRTGVQISQLAIGQDSHGTTTPTPRGTVDASTTGMTSQNQASNVQVETSTHIAGGTTGLNVPKALTTEKWQGTPEQNLLTTTSIAQGADVGRTTKEAHNSNVQHQLETASHLAQGTTKQNLPEATTTKKMQAAREPNVGSTTTTTTTMAKGKTENILGIATSQNGQAINVDGQNALQQTNSQNVTDASTTQRSQVTPDQSISTTNTLQTITHQNALEGKSSNSAQGTNNQNPLVAPTSTMTTQLTTEQTNGTKTSLTQGTTDGLVNLVGPPSQIAEGTAGQNSPGVVSQKVQVNTEQNIGTTTPVVHATKPLNVQPTTLVPLGKSSNIAQGISAPDLPGATTTKALGLTGQDIETTTPLTPRGTELTTLGSITTLQAQEQLSTNLLKPVISELGITPGGTSGTSQVVQGTTDANIIGTKIAQGAQETTPGTNEMVQNITGGTVMLQSAQGGIQSSTGNIQLSQGSADANIIGIKTAQGAHGPSQGTNEMVQNITGGTVTLQNDQAGIQSSTGNIQLSQGSADANIIGTNTAQGAQETTPGTNEIVQNTTGGTVTLQTAQRGIQLSQGTADANIIGTNTAQNAQGNTQGTNEMAQNKTDGTVTLQNAQGGIQSSTGNIQLSQGTADANIIGTNTAPNAQETTPGTNEMVQNITGGTVTLQSAQGGIQSSTGNIQLSQGSADANIIGTNTAQGAQETTPGTNEIIQNTTGGTVTLQSAQGGIQSSTGNIQLSQGSADANIIGTKTAQGARGPSQGTNEMVQNTTGETVTLQNAQGGIQSSTRNIQLSQGSADANIIGTNTAQNAHGNSQGTTEIVQNTTGGTVTSQSAQGGIQSSTGNIQLSQGTTDANIIGTNSFGKNAQATNQANSEVTTIPIGLGTHVPTLSILTTIYPPGASEQTVSTTTSTPTVLKANLDLVSLADGIKTLSMETPAASPCDNYNCSTIAPHCVLVQQKCNTTQCSVGPKCSDNAPNKDWCSSGLLVLDQLFQQITCNPSVQNSCPEHSVCDGSGGVHKCCWIGTSSAPVSSSPVDRSATTSLKGQPGNGGSGLPFQQDARSSNSIAEASNGKLQPSSSLNPPHGNTASIDKTTSIKTNVADSANKKSTHLFGPQAKTVLQSNSKTLNNVDQSMSKAVSSIDLPQLPLREILTVQESSSRSNRLVHGTPDLNNIGTITSQNAQGNIQGNTLNTNVVNQPTPKQISQLDHKLPASVNHQLIGKSKTTNTNVSGESLLNPHVPIDSLTPTENLANVQTMPKKTAAPPQNAVNGQSVSLNTNVAGQSPLKPSDASLPAQLDTPAVQNNFRNNNLLKVENTVANKAGLLETPPGNISTSKRKTVKNMSSSETVVKTKPVHSSQQTITGTNKPLPNFDKSSSNPPINVASGSSNASPVLHTHIEASQANAQNKNLGPIQTSQHIPSASPTLSGNVQTSGMTSNEFVVNTKQPGAGPDFSSQVEFPSNNQRLSSTTLGGKDVSPPVLISNSGQQRVQMAPTPYSQNKHSDNMIPQSFQTQGGHLGTYRPGDIIIDIPTGGSTNNHATITGVTETGVIHLGTHSLDSRGHPAPSTLHTPPEPPAQSPDGVRSHNFKNLKNILTTAGASIMNNIPTLPAESTVPLNSGPSILHENIASRTSMNSAMPLNEIPLTDKTSVSFTSTGGNIQSNGPQNVGNVNLHASVMGPTERNANIQDPASRPTIHADVISPIGPAASDMNPANANEQIIAPSMLQSGYMQDGLTAVPSSGNIQHQPAGSITYPDQGKVDSQHNQGFPASPITLTGQAHTQKSQTFGSPIPRRNMVQHEPKHVPSMPNGHNQGGFYQDGKTMGSTKYGGSAVQGGQSFGSLGKSPQGDRLLGYNSLGAEGIQSGPIKDRSNLVGLSGQTVSRKNTQSIVKENNHVGFSTLPKVTKNGQTNQISRNHKSRQAYQLDTGSSPNYHSTTQETGRIQTRQNTNSVLSSVPTSPGHSMGSSLPEHAHIPPAPTVGSAIPRASNGIPGPTIGQTLPVVNQRLNVGAPIQAHTSTFKHLTSKSKMGSSVQRSASIHTGPTASTLAIDSAIRSGIHGEPTNELQIPRTERMHEVPATRAFHKDTLSKQGLKRATKPRMSFVENTQTKLDAHPHPPLGQSKPYIQNILSQKKKLMSLQNTQHRTRIQTMVHVKPHGNGHNITKTIKITSPRSNKRNLPITVKSNVFRQTPVTYKDHLGQTRKAPAYGVAISTTVGKHVTKPGFCYKPCGLDVCANECIHDGQCPGLKKCCHTGCGHVCTDPLPVLPAAKPGTCPFPMQIKACPNVRKCNQDSQCPGSSKCCCISSGCRVCVPQRNLLPIQPITHSKKTTVSTSGNKTDVTTHISSTIITKNRPVRHKPGFCHLPCGPFQCTQECSNDGHCPGNSKCCNTGCGKVCSSPLQRIPRTKDGHCPALDPNRVCPQVPHCRHDHECPGSAKCCCIGPRCRVCVTQGSPLYMSGGLIPALPFLK